MYFYFLYCTQHKHKIYVRWSVKVEEDLCFVKFFNFGDMGLRFLFACIENVGIYSLSFLTYSESFCSLPTLKIFSTTPLAVIVALHILQMATSGWSGCGAVCGCCPSCCMLLCSYKSKVGKEC